MPQGGVEGAVGRHRYNQGLVGVGGRADGSTYRSAL